MKIKKSILILIILVLTVFLNGCGSNKQDSNNTGSETTKVTIVDEEFNEKGSGTLKCVTEAVAADGIDVDLSYVITYKRGNILVLRSVSKITSDDSSTLDGYENAYQDIRENYTGLDYYDTSLIRDSNTVTYEAIINYEKIDTDRLLAIEGEEDNVIANGKAKLSLWLELAEKFGTTCEEV